MAFLEVIHAHPWDKSLGTSGGSTNFFIIELSIRNLNYTKFNKKDKLNILTLHKKKKSFILSFHQQNEKAKRDR